MARPRKSPEARKENAKIIPGLTQPAYSGQVGGNPLVVYVHYHPEGETHPRVMVYSFLGMYAAKWFVTRLISDDDYELGKWKYNELDTDLTTSRGIHIKMASDQLEKVLAYEYATPEEEEWKDESLAKSIGYLKWGKWEHRPANDTVVIETEEGPQERKLSRKEIKQAERAARREQKNLKREADPMKAPRPKIDKTGMITAGELAEQMSVLPRDFRAALRKLKMEKPEGGWHWPTDQADAIKKKVKGALK